MCNVWFLVTYSCTVDVHTTKDNSHSTWLLTILSSLSKIVTALKIIQDLSEELLLNYVGIIGGELVKLLQERYGQPYPPDKVLKMFYQMCRGVAHMHKQTPPVIHRDLKVWSDYLTMMIIISITTFSGANSVQIAQRWIAMDIRSLSSQSAGGFNTIHCFGIYYTVYTKKVDICSIELAHWLTTQTPDIHCYSPPSNSCRICAWKCWNVLCRNKWIKIIFLCYITGILLF